MIQAIPQPGHYIVWCDTVTCPAGIAVRATDHDTARAAAVEAGWTADQYRRDHCPDCSRSTQ